MSSQRLITPDPCPPPRGLRLPPGLQPGDCIAIAAPASPCDPSRLQRGVRLLEAMGYRVRVPPEVFAAAGYLAGDDLGRAASFNRLLADPGVHAILCARGGYGSMRLLEAIDYRLAAQRPKRFIGFSDLTALLAALQSRSGLVVFHGPTVTQLAEAEGATLRSVARQLAGSGTVALRAGRVLRTGRASGPLAGGNLTILCHLAGTPYFPPLAGRILLLEDRGEALYRVDRMLRHLQLTGCLEGIAGLALGRFDDCGAPEALDRLVLELVGAAAIPILADLPVGHGRCNRVVPLGVPARLDGERRQLRILLPSPVP